MDTVLQKHSCSGNERYWFNPDKFGLSEKESTFIFNNRKRLLKNATKQEIVLAHFLEDSSVDFFAQFPVFCPKIHTTFWCDFFIPKNKLVLEIDGSSHHRLTTITKDTYRDAFMQEQGIQVIRITNKQVDSGEYSKILLDMVESCRMKIKTPKDPNAPIHVPNEKLIRTNLSEISNALNSFNGKEICFATKNRRIIKLMTEPLQQEHPLFAEIQAIKDILIEKGITTYWKYATHNSKKWMGRHLNNKVTQLYMEAVSANATEFQLS